MSVLSAAGKNAVVDSSEFKTDIHKKACNKIDATVKLQIIQALDNGRPKAEIAREYSIHPQTITHIYKQKDSIIKKYTQKYNLLKEVCSLNLDRNLLEWFEQQYTSGNMITEDQLYNKAKEILKGLSEEFTSINEWLLNFRTRHNINKYSCDNNDQTKVEWKRFLKSSNPNDVYVGGVCALAHSMDFNSYLTGQTLDNYVSLIYIINTLGTEKVELAVIGNDYLETAANLKSLPVNYYHCVSTQVNDTVFSAHLSKWDNYLASQDKSVTLLLDVPDDFLRQLHFNHIRLISITDMTYVIKILEKIVESFKYHYRRLQITRTTTYGRDSCTFLDYIHMIGMAWYSVSYKYVQSICFPPEDCSLYFSISDDKDNDCSLFQWCKTKNVPIHFEGDLSKTLDKYILCDRKLPCINFGQIGEISKVSEELAQRICQPTGGMEAYQAMKRLVNYLQGESAGGPVMKYAKYLENHLEYGALLQMHQIIASTNDSA